MWFGAVGALVLMYVVGELAARLWIRRHSGFYVWPPGLRLRIEPDRSVLPRLEQVVRFDVNSQGERGGEVPASADGVYRILVVGGSHPEGLLLDQDTTWPGALQRILSAPAHQQQLGATTVHVGCVARSGIGSEALAMILERILPRYPRIDTIIILVGASDVMRWLEEGAPDAPPAKPDVAEIFRSHPENRFGWHPRRGATGEVARRLRRRWLQPLTFQPRAGRWMGRAREMRARAAVVHTTTASPEPLLTHFDHSLRRVIWLARTRAQRVIIARQPWCDDSSPEAVAQVWNGGVGKAWKEEVSEFFSFDVLCRLMSALDTRAALVAREVGVEQIDLKRAVPSTAENYYDFFHATPQGAAIVAHVVAEAVLAGYATPRHQSAVDAHLASARSAVGFGG